MSEHSNRNPVTIVFPVSPGDEVRDSLSGFTGIVVALTQWFNQCQRATVQPPLDKDGKIPPAEAFDVEQLEVTFPNKVRPKLFAPAPVVETTSRSGGPMPAISDRPMAR
jgi:hypothetical protein